MLDKSKFYWRAMPLGDWHIYYGKSMCLVAEGPGWTQYFGFNLYQRIINGEVKMSDFGYEKNRRRISDD